MGADPTTPNGRQPQDTDRAYTLRALRGDITTTAAYNTVAITRYMANNGGLADTELIEALEIGDLGHGDDPARFVPFEATWENHETDIDPATTAAFDQITSQPDNTHIDPELDQFLDTDDPDYDWLVEDLVERHDRIIVTGEEGHGKTTLLRQLAVQFASGIHPFTGDPINPLQVLYVDCENSERQIRRKLRQLRDAAGDHYTGGRLRLRVLGHALDIADTAIEADLAARIDAQSVDILIIGPLYKLLFDDPIKELAAKAVADAIDNLRAIRGSAVFMEAHSPYAEGNGKKRLTRPYGASLWSRWPEFGIHIAGDGALTHWRGQRDERTWPTRLERSQPWPWEATDTPTDSDPEWHGPTECAAAIAALLAELDVEMSVNKITDELRARGNSYRNETVRTAARLARNDGRISYRLGPRNSDLYRSQNGQGALSHNALEYNNEPF